MNLDLSDKIAFVSGSTQGIGLATALKLAQLNANVYVNGRTQKRVDEAIAQIKKNCPNAKIFGFAGDLSVTKDVENLFKAVPKLDILVNNMAIYEAKKFEEITDDEWRRFFEINVMSGVRLCRFYFPKMKESNWGRIVFVNSDSAIDIPPDMIHYGMTKTAQLAVARGLAELTRGTNVTVNSVIVGLTETEGLKDLQGRIALESNKTEVEVHKEFFEGYAKSSLIQRGLKPEEIANMIVYLSSQASSATNGSALRVESGLLKSII